MATKSTPASTKQDKQEPYSGPYRKPRADLYTAMLLLALVALIIGTVFFYLENQRYKFEFRAPGAAQAGGSTLPLAEGVVPRAALPV